MTLVDALHMSFFLWNINLLHLRVDTFVEFQQIGWPMSGFANWEREVSIASDPAAVLWLHQISTTSSVLLHVWLSEHLKTMSERSRALCILVLWLQWSEPQLSLSLLRSLLLWFLSDVGTIEALRFPTHHRRRLTQSLGDWPQCRKISLRRWDPRWGQWVHCLESVLGFRPSLKDV